MAIGNFSMDTILFPGFGFSWAIFNVVLLANAYLLAVIYPGSDFLLLSILRDGCFSEDVHMYGYDRYLLKLSADPSMKLVTMVQML